MKKLAFPPVRLDAGPEPSAAHPSSRTAHGRRQLRGGRLVKGCYSIFILRGVDEVGNILVIASSLSSSSALGARSQSTKWASGNSLPITGVTSKELNWSRIPVGLRGSIIKAFFPLDCFSVPLTGVSVALRYSVADGDMIALEKNLIGGSRFVYGGCDRCLGK